MATPLNEKQRKALAFLEKNRSAYVSDIAKVIYDDEGTARNVLEQLLRRGHVKKYKDSKIIRDHFYLSHRRVKVTRYEIIQ